MSPWRILGTALVAACMPLPAVSGVLPLSADPLIPAPPSVYRDASLSGGPGKDGIPSIDNPIFTSASAADGQLNPGDRVIGIYRNGEARAYPQAVLVWHEIVNDTVGGDNVAVTYCPLTGTALGFLRGDTELGVSGRLVNSNLIMYDRESDSLWPQVLGAAIDGPLEGRGLAEIRVVWTTWENWRQRYPETRVLSEDTGFLRNYERDPYGSYTPAGGYYAEDASPVFPVLNESDRYPPKREIFGFRTSAGAVAVDREHLADEEMLLHEHGGERFLIVHDPGLDTAWVFRAGDKEPPEYAEITFGAEGPEHPALAALEPVNGFEAMWFAWIAFYPESAVIDGLDQ